MRIYLIVIILHIVGVGFAQNCGTERWDVKTLSDNDTTKIDFEKIVRTTVHEQANLELPQEKLRSRLNSEITVYSLNCFIIGYKRESHDKDIHLIIEDIETDDTMVAEIPSHECFEIQQTSRYTQFKELEKWFIDSIGNPNTKYIYLEEHIPVNITGIGFFDIHHGQIGMAGNGREIHPVLSINLLTK